jgi:type IX secretion system PorP/SprF family membrane protein
MKKYYILFSIILIHFKVSAQDIHFSQFYAAPLLLNPALTGVNEGNYRASVIYRNQWNSVTTPYSTPYASFDMNHVLFNPGQKGVLSLGGLLFSDVAGTGSFTNFTVMGSIAYMFYVSDKSFFSIGLQPGFVQKHFDPNDLTFESQFNGTTPNPDQSNGENFSTTSIQYFDINAGIFFESHASDNLDIYIGAAESHLTQPNESFYDITTNSNGSSNDLQMKTTVHGGMRIGLNDNWNLIPSAIFLLQGSNQEINAGLTAEDKVNNDFHFFFGGYYRVNDAAIAILGGEYKKVRLAFSYDVNVSSLQSASDNRGGFEISLQYTGLFPKKKQSNKFIYSPRF